MNNVRAVRAEAENRGVATVDRSDLGVMMELLGKVSTGLEKDGTPVMAKATCRMPWERTTGKNIFTLIRGTDPELTNDLIVVQSYYDSISVVPSLAPGAQNTGGIVGLLELAKVLKAHPPKRSVLLLATGSHFVCWEGIADWVLRHAPRGGTDQDEEVTAIVKWAIPGGSVLLSVVFIITIVLSTRQMNYWQNLVDENPEAERRASGMSSLRFMIAVLLIPVALIALLSNVETTFQYVSPEPIHELLGEKDMRMKFSFSLDLSSGSSDMGVYFTSPVLRDEQYDGRAHLSYMNQYSNRLLEIAKKQDTKKTFGTHLQDCVKPDGRSWTDFSPLENFLLDGTVIMRTGNPCLTLMTIEDARPRTDTPLDNLEKGRFDYENLTNQIRATGSIIMAALNDKTFLEQKTALKIRDRVKQVETRVVEANYRESFVADTPVVDALVVYKRGIGHGNRSGQNVSGVRGLRMRMADGRGKVTNPFIIAAGSTNISRQVVYVRPYRFSDDDGRITYAPDRGESGEKSYPLDLTVKHPEVQHQVVTFRCEPLDLYFHDNSRYLRSVGAATYKPPVIFDTNDATPQEYGFDLPKDNTITTGLAENVVVVYIKKTPPGTKPGRVKYIMGSRVFGVEYLLTNTEEAIQLGLDRPEGIGFAAVPTIAEGADAEQMRREFPPYMVRNSDLNAARDLFRIDDSRMKRFARFGVVKEYDEDPKAENERLATIHHDAKVHLDTAENALKNHEYASYRSNLDKALGLEARAYPDVKGTATDIVKGFMFYCVLLLPFAFFCERLFFGFPDIRKQLFGFAGFFLAIFGVMSLVHPVFRITDAPYVILLAFIILVLAVSVLVIIIMKFNEQMGKMRRQAAKVHEADVGRLSSVGTAVMLGISNMKKRKVRTTLTTLTLILLTFTVMSFTSVRTETHYNQISQPHKAGYTGMLLRDPSWNALEQNGLEQFRRHFERTFDAEVLDSDGQRKTVKVQGKVLPRAWLSSVSRASGRKNFKFRVMRVGSDESCDCSGLTGLSPDETLALDFNSLLVAGRWFEKPDEMSVIITSDNAYNLLKFEKGDIEAGRAKVRLRGVELTVVGVLDSVRIEQLRDLDDESYTPLDIMSKSQFGATLTEGQFSQNQLDIAKLPHISGEVTSIVPYELCRKLGGRIASAAVVFRTENSEENFGDFEEYLKKFLVRVGMTVFTGNDGQAKAFSSMALSSVGNVGNLFVPILIAALIVLNTMMGSVHERAHEIGIYSSVGLAPVHISALFLAESCVYAVMGAISGYVLGTVAGKVVAMMAIPGLTLNYSSLSAVFSTIVVMGTVILSTIYPARMAAAMSVPDVTRRWKFPDPDGDVWQFEFPFTVATNGVVGLFVFLDNYFDSYKEESIGSFYADNVKFYSMEDTYGHGYVVELDCWLAPFDLAVSQNVQLLALPTEDEGITRIELKITRLSGEVSSWKRLNRGFLTLMRKQFLIWRTVPMTVKDEYREEGKVRLKSMHGVAS